MYYEELDKNTDESGNYSCTKCNEVIRDPLAKLLQDNTQFCQVKFWENEDNL